jgi:predicted aldo/keto reductase-like oxidoreductase
MRALESASALAAVLEAALAAGINHIETAPAYGPAEAFLGQALAALAQRDRAAHAGLVLTSKLLPGAGEGVGLAEGMAQLRASLARLGIARLDNLAVHGLNTPAHLAWALQGAGADLLEAALAEGLVGQVGFSSHGETPLIEAALASGRFSFCSLHLHLLDPERMPLARQALAAGIGVMAISPADKGGRLYDPPDSLVADCAPFAPLELAYRYLLAEGISGEHPVEVWEQLTRAEANWSGKLSECTGTFTDMSILLIRSIQPFPSQIQPIV